MKNVVLFLLMCFMVACSQDDLSISNGEEDIQSYPSSKDLKSGGDGEYDLLGFGYDITGEYLASNSSRYSVIDVKKLIKDEKTSTPVDCNVATSEDTHFYYGSDALDYIKDINEKTITKKGNKSSGLFGLGKKLFGFTATLNVESEGNSKMTFLSKDSYARSETVIKIKQLKINRTPSELYPYLSTDFKKHLNTYTPEQLVKTYGTHVLTDISLGGRLFSEFKSTYVEDNSYEMKKKQVKAGLKASLLKIGLNSDNNVTITDITTINKKNITQNLHVRTSGGNKAINITYDFTENTPSNLETQEWKNSVYSGEGKNATLVDVEWDKAYPIYEFIQDPQKREEVKKAVIKYIEDWQIQMQSVVPLIQWFDYKTFSYAYTVDPNYDYGGTWRKDKAIAFVLDKQLEGTVPLIQWYCPDNNAYAYTMNPNYIYGKGWYKHGTIGAYVYTSQVKGTLPFFQWFNYDNFAYAYTCDPYYDYGKGWTNQGTIGVYVIPLK